MRNRRLHRSALNYNPEATENDGSCFYEEMWTEEVIDGVTYLVIDDYISESVVLDADEMWLLSGPTVVETGVILTIMPGTTIYTDGSEDIFLSISMGAKIAACGTAEEPIMFTPMIDDPEPGYWGGLVLNGLAPINNGPTAYGESGTGADAGDNSGSLCYVRVEYAGKMIGTDNEMNAFSFIACGARTELNHLQAYMCVDDGFEFFGGPHCGMLWQQVMVMMDLIGNTVGLEMDNSGLLRLEELHLIEEGIEGYNLNQTDVELLPYSDPKLANISVINLSETSHHTGFYLSSDTKGSFMNMVIHGFQDEGCQVTRNLTIENMEAEELTLTHSIIDNANPLLFQDNDFNIVAPSFSFANAANNNTVASGGSSVGFLYGIFGTTTTGAGDPTTLDPWFLPANYIGAVPDGDDWTAGWTIHL